jgi:hypothetical protein
MSGRIIVTLLILEAQRISHNCPIIHYYFFDCPSHQYCYYHSHYYDWIEPLLDY